MISDYKNTKGLTWNTMHSLLETITIIINVLKSYNVWLNYIFEMILITVWIK